MKQRLAPLNNGLATGISGRYALSWQVWLWASATPEVILAFSGNFENVARSALAIAVPLGVAAVLILIPGKRWLPRLTAVASRTALVLATFLVTSVANSFSVAVIATWPQVDLVGNLNQIVGGTIFHLWFFVVVSEIVNGRLEFIDEQTRLATLKSQLERIVLWREANVAATKESEYERIRLHLNLVRDRIASTALDREQIAGLNNDIIRALLSEPESSAASPSQPVPYTPSVPRHRTFRLMMRMALTGMMPVEVTVAAFIASTWVVTGFAMNSWSVILGASVLSGLTLYLALRCVRILASRQTPRSSAARTLMVFGLWLLSGLLSSVPALLISGIPSAAIVSMGVQTLLITFLVSTMLAYRAVGTEISSQAAAENDRMERELLANSTELRQLHERIHHFIHGDLQSLIVSLERRWLKDSTPATPFATQLQEELNPVLNRLTEQLDARRNSADVERTVEDLQVMWSGVLAIDVNWEPAALNAVRSSTVAQGVLSGVLIEVITNTAKHDEATNVSLTVSLADEHTLELQSVSDGPSLGGLRLTSSAPSTRRASRSSQGNGIQLFDDVCLRWSLSRTGTRTHFDALIPLPPVTSAILDDVRTS